MRHRQVVRRGLGSLLLAGTVLGFRPALASADVYEQAVGRALRLLPRRPPKVMIVERADAPHFRGGQARTEAFAYRRGAVVYLIRDGVTLQNALKRRQVFDCALAALIWHELAHLDGADELAAQEAEEQLWRQFIVTQRVDSIRGMRYLTLLRARR